MSERLGWGERTAWIAAVAALASCVMWMALGCGIGLLGRCGVPPVAGAVVRAMGHALAAVSRAWPVLPGAALCSMILALGIGRVPTKKGRMPDA
ncbi:MAG TPA: hypothetical protein VMS93_03270 [Candidatus Saccharimonadales bacterium]|nr:hypothetical protein [Candidatus Saccharimonadales bacterium]